MRRQQVQIQFVKLFNALVRQGKVFPLSPEQTDLVSQGVMARPCQEGKG